MARFNPMGERTEESKIIPPPRRNFVFDLMQVAVILFMTRIVMIVGGVGFVHIPIVDRAAFFVINLVLKMMG